MAERVCDDKVHDLEDMVGARLTASPVSMAWRSLPDA
jgi:hypothetical protein